MDHGTQHMGHDAATHDEPSGDGKPATVVLHTGGLNWAFEKAIVEAVLSRRPGV